MRRPPRSLCTKICLPTRAASPSCLPHSALLIAIIYCRMVSVIRANELRLVETISAGKRFFFLRSCRHKGWSAKPGQKSLTNLIVWCEQQAAFLHSCNKEREENERSCRQKYYKTRVSTIASSASPSRANVLKFIRLNDSFYGVIVLPRAYRGQRLVSVFFMQK